MKKQSLMCSMCGKHCITTKAEIPAEMNIIGGSQLICRICHEQRTQAITDLLEAVKNLQEKLNCLT